MRILGQFIVIMMISLMLQACASSRVAEELQSGKISFEDGNFKSAFHKLLPLASDGNAAAEYAIGYMYYYGYGTTQDTESGMFWMRKSAEQQYHPAIKALQIISQNKVSEEPTQQLTADQSIKIESNQILRALTENAEKQTAPYSSVNENVTADKFVQNHLENTAIAVPQNPSAKRTAADFNLERTKKYTLQLMGSYHLADIKHMQNHLHLEKSSYCAHINRNGRDWYILAYGKYPASYLAQLALDDLPVNIREMKPWVRQVDNMTILT